MPREMLTGLIDPVTGPSGVILARCPVPSHGRGHGDRNRSLQARQGEKAWLLKCWAGCSLPEICSALNLRVADLFFDTPLPRGQRPAPKPPRLDRLALAFQFELAALDRRLRAEKVLSASTHLDVEALPDDPRDRLMGLVASAYRDLERADLLEHVSDTLRWTSWEERQDRHAA